MGTLNSDTKITKEHLETLGFEYIDYGDDTPYEAWRHKLSKVEVWEYNSKYWVIDILDQAGINRIYRTLGELNTFFKAVGMPLDIK